VIAGELGETPSGGLAAWLPSTNSITFVRQHVHYGYWAWHDANRDAVIGILKDTLKVSDERAAFEYHVRSGSFVKFDAGLVGQEQRVADILYDGHAIKKEGEGG
jgi:hypothetical protein